MESVVDFLRRNVDLLWKVAVAAAALSILYPLVQAYYSWIGGENVFSDAPTLSFWILGGYFFDPFVAALAFGALLRDWRAAYLAMIGLALQLVLITGTIFTDDVAIGSLAVGVGADQLGVSEFQGYLQSYIASILRWVWLLGLIAFGVVIGRKLGDLFAELRTSP